MKPKRYLSLAEYYEECLIMLERQPHDYHVGAAERAVIAECYEAGRPITSAVSYIMRGGVTM